MAHLKLSFLKYWENIFSLPVVSVELFMEQHKCQMKASPIIFEAIILTYSVPPS